MGDRTVDDLVAEAVFLARRAYGVALSARDAERYVEAHAALRLMSGTGAAAQDRLVQQAISRGADVEALEFAWRRSDRRNLLTRKLHVLAFLIEADPRYATRFLNDRPRRAHAILSLGAHTVRAAWKYCVGRWWLWRLAAAHA
jgi:hypothetical protein